MQLSVEDAAAPGDNSTEKQLARAVIERAILDINMAGRDGRLARIFLTTESGPWAKSRDFWADLADVDPAVLRERAHRMLGALTLVSRQCVAA